MFGEDIGKKTKNDFEKLTKPTKLSDLEFAQISLGNDHLLARTVRGTIYGYGQVCCYLHKIFYLKLFFFTTFFIKKE